VFYHLPEQQPPITLIRPDDPQFWRTVGADPLGRYALVIGDPTQLDTATVIVAGVLDMHRYIDPFIGSLLRDLSRAAYTVRLALTATEWSMLQPPPAPPVVPVPAEVPLTQLTHTRLRVPHTRLSITRYRELPTVDGVAFTATLRIDGEPAGTIQNEGVGGMTTFHPNGNGRFGALDLAQYAGLCRSAAGLPVREEFVLDDLITEADTSDFVARTVAAGRLPVRLVLWTTAAGDYGQLDHANTAPIRDDDDLHRLREQLLAEPCPAGGWWQMWTGTTWHNLTAAPANPHTDRQESTA
jgi:hypothetical protein